MRRLMRGIPVYVGQVIYRLLFNKLGKISPLDWHLPPGNGSTLCGPTRPFKPYSLDIFGRCIRWVDAGESHNWESP